MRATDRQGRNYLSTSRYVEESGQWYFRTREDELLGPYPSVEEAADAVEFYIALMGLHETGVQDEVA